MTAGYVWLLWFLSMLFSDVYRMDIVDTQGSIIHAINRSDVNWAASIRDYDHEWSYDREDWGSSYEICKHLTKRELDECVGEAFTEKAFRFQKNGRVILWIHLGFSLAAILYIFNRSPLKTVIVFLALTVILSLWALPIYTSTLKNRDPSRIKMKRCADGGHLTGIEALAWCAAFASVAIIAFSIPGILYGVVISALAFLGFSIGVVVCMIKFHKSRGKFSECQSDFHEREVFVLTLVAIPHYMVTGALALVVAGYILYICCCTDSDSSTDSVTVIYRVRYVFRVS